MFEQSVDEKVEGQEEKLQARLAAFDLARPSFYCIGQVFEVMEKGDADCTETLRHVKACMLSVFFSNDLAKLLKDDSTVIANMDCHYSDSQRLPLKLQMCAGKPPLPVQNSPLIIFAYASCLKRKKDIVLATFTERERNKQA